LSATVDPEAIFRSFLESRGTDVDVVSIAYHVDRIQRRFLGALESEILRPQGLSFRGYVVLMTLWMLGPQNVTELAEAQGTTKAAAVQAINTLEKEGFARRKPGKDDRRRVSIELTALGRKRVERAHAQANKYELELFGNLSKTERATLAKLLRKV